MLKAMLTIYFVVEPHMVPHLLLWKRIETLRYINGLLSLRRTEYSELEKQYPKSIVPIVASLHYQMRVKLLREVMGLYDKDSFVGRSEEKDFARDFGVLEKKATESKEEVRGAYIRFHDCVSLSDMQKLLTWADISAISEAEILGPFCQNEAGE